MRITGISDATFAENKSFVDVTFDTENHGALDIELTSDILEDIVAKLSELLRFLQNEAAFKNDHFEIRAVEVIAAAAQAAHGGEMLVVSLQTPNGIVQNFALRPEISAQLRPEMRRAEESARRQAGQTRQ